MGKVKEWLALSILALIMFGIWGLFGKLSTLYIDPRSALVYEAVGAALIGLITLMMIGFRIESNVLGVTFGVLTGITGTLGVLFFLVALSKGGVSITVTLTALYPIFTIFLAFLFLHEPITVKQGIGIFLAIIAILLLSS